LRERYDEFGFQTSNVVADKVGFLVGALRDVVSAEHVMLGMSFDVEKDEVSCLFGEKGKEPRFRIGMAVTMATPDQAAFLSGPGLVIDTTPLYAPGAVLHYLHKDFK
jgi:hypothetical protein